MMPTLPGYLFVRACVKGLFSDPYYLFLPTNSNINSYADDTQLFLRGLNPTATQTLLQSHLTLVSDWFQANGMTNNLSKCLSMWFGTNANDLSVSLNGIIIDTANTM